MKRISLCILIFVMVANTVPLTQLFHLGAIFQHLELNTASTASLAEHFVSGMCAGDDFTKEHKESHKHLPCKKCETSSNGIFLLNSVVVFTCRVIISYNNKEYSSLPESCLPEGRIYDLLRPPVIPAAV